MVQSPMINHLTSDCTILLDLSNPIHLHGWLIRHPDAADQRYLGEASAQRESRSENHRETPEETIGTCGLNGIYS